MVRVKQLVVGMPEELLLVPLLIGKQEAHSLGFSGVKCHSL